LPNVRDEPRGGQALPSAARKWPMSALALAVGSTPSDAGKGSPGNDACGGSAGEPPLALNGELKNDAHATMKRRDACLTGDRDRRMRFWRVDLMRRTYRSSVERSLVSHAELATQNSKRIRRGVAL
jgi:hypothetical protein